jgi:hypothetical protein
MRAVYSVLITVLAGLLLSGCGILELFGEPGVSSSDPYDSDCNLRSSYHDNWQKYSDFDYRIPVGSRSYEAQQYAKAQADIADKAARVYTLERDMAIEEDMKNTLIEYKQSLVTGHKKNILKAFMRLSFYTADVTWQHAVAGKGYGKLLTGPAKSGVHIAGESMKFINSYAPSDSVLGIDTSTVEGKVQDVERAGWMEAVSSMGSGKAVAQEMATKSIRYAMQVPDAKLSDAEIGILRKEHIEMKRIDTLIADADQRNFKRLWEKRALEQEVVHLKSSLFDLEHDEKDRTDEMLKAECRSKMGLDE